MYTFLQSVSPLAFREDFLRLKHEGGTDPVEAGPLCFRGKARRSSLYHLQAGFIASYDSLSR